LSAHFIHTPKFNQNLSNKVVKDISGISTVRIYAHYNELSECYSVMMFLVKFPLISLNFDVDGFTGFFSQMLDVVRTAQDCVTLYFRHYTYLSCSYMNSMYLADFIPPGENHISKTGIEGICNCRQRCKFLVLTQHTHLRQR
jgi:hypothetical protein